MWPVIALILCLEYCLFQSKCSVQSNWFNWSPWVWGEMEQMEVGRVVEEFKPLQKRKEGRKCSLTCTLATRIIFHMYFFSPAWRVDRWLNWSKAGVDSLLPEDSPTTQAGSCVTLRLSPQNGRNSRTRHGKLTKGTHVWKDALLDLL